MSDVKLKCGDKVVHIDKKAVRGVIKGVHVETTAKVEQRDKGLMIEVLWDSGALSFLAPEKLEVVEAAAEG